MQVNQALRNYPDAAMDPKRFKEYRKDGWPLCPQCGEDELFSALLQVVGGNQPYPTMADCLANGFACYSCDWTDD